MSTPGLDGTATARSPRFECWGAHNDDNDVSFFLSGGYETAKGEARSLAKVIRTGRWVCEITDMDAFRAIAMRGPQSEKAIRAAMAPPRYDLDHGSAASIAADLVSYRRGTDV